MPGRRGDRLCQAPFAQLHFEPDGHVSVCSKSTYRRIGHVDADDLLALWRGPAIEAIRAALAADRFPEGCEVCAWNLEQGNVADHPALGFDAYGAVADAAWPAILEFAFSNLCNLACIQCSPELSSTIRQQRGLPPFRSFYGDRFFAQIQPFLEHARGVSLLGGEPFLQPECFRVLDALIAAGRRIPVHVTTNGTRFDERVERVLDRLPTSIAVSLDGVRPETIERIRVGADARQLLANARRFAERARAGGQGRFTLNFCLLRENWPELPDFFLLAQELSAEVWVMPVTHPSEHSVFTLPVDELQRIAAAWRARRDEVLRSADAAQRRVWESITSMIEARASCATRDGVWGVRSPLESASRSIAAADLDGALAELAKVPANDGRRGRALTLQAWILLQRGRLDEAAAALQSAATALGRQPTDRARAGVLLLQVQLHAHRNEATSRDAAAEALVRLARESPDAVSTALPDGAMPSAWKLMALGLPGAALAVAACTSREDRWFARSLLFRAGLLTDALELEPVQELLRIAEQAGGRTPEWCLRAAWFDLRRGESELARAEAAEGERALAASEGPHEAWLAQGLRLVRAELASPVTRGA